MKYTQQFCQLVPCIFLVVFSTLSFADNRCLADKKANELQRNLNKFVAKTIEKNPEIPGINLHVQSIDLCFEANIANGVSDRKTGTKLLTNHAFRIASNTKTYTAATVLRLAEEGAINIDLSIDKYLPSHFTRVLKNGGYQLNTMSVRNILNHMSGLPDHTHDKRYFESIKKNPTHQWTALEQVSLLVKYQMAVGFAAQNFAYSDTGYILLATAIEHVTGMTMSSAFRHYLKFNHLGIDNTWHETKEPQPSTVAGRIHQYFDKMDTYDWHPSLDLHGGGGLVATAEDMSIFLRALMTNQIFEEPKTLQIMKTVLPRANIMNYGMGIFSKKMSDHVVWGHTGFWNTFSFYLAELDIVISGSIAQNNTIKGSIFTSEVLAVLINTLDETHLKN